MLLQFNFKNYRSFKNENTLDMAATRMSEYDYHVRQIGNERVLPVSAIYGANASGKSNVYKALKYMTQYVLESFSYGGEKEKMLSANPFLFDTESKDKESIFEVYFIDPKDTENKTYNYGFLTDTKGVKEEWLYTKAKSPKSKYRNIFYRERGQELNLTGIPTSLRKSINLSLENEALILSLGAKLKIELLKMVYDWFNSNVLVDYRDLDMYKGLTSHTLHNLKKDLDSIKDAVKYISAFDDSIKAIEVEEIESDDNTTDTISIASIHKIHGREEIVKLDFEEESSGTLKMFSLFPFLKHVLEKGSILFVDDLNTHLHPLLIRNIVLAFANPELNKNNAQLIFTTHDTWILDANLLRRDEIWFTEKDATEVSTLYSLADFFDEKGVKIRKDEDFQKNYLLGKYGAIPKMDNFNILGEEQD